MVTHHRIFSAALVLAAFTLICSIATSPVAAVGYHIDREWVVVWINTDRSIDIQYNITITYETPAQGYLRIGIPAGGFAINSARNLSGNSLSWSDVSGGGNYAVEVFFGHSMNPGDNATVILMATVPNMLYADSMNPGNVGMQFTPTYFNDATVTNLRVAIVPPEGINGENIKTSETAFFTTVNGSFAVYWEQNDLSPGTRFTYGVSFPEGFVNPSTGGIDRGLLLTIGGVVAGVLFLVLLLVAFRATRKKVYEKPKIALESLGSAKGLTAVEAAVTVGAKPVKVLTMILFSLLRKQYARIMETEPLVKVEALKPAEGSMPRYYEIDFLRAIKPDGKLDEEQLAKTYLYLRDAVDKKMRGYSRTDTENYYKSVVAQAWDQVKQGGTPELKEEAINQNIEWLLLDEKYPERFTQTFPPNVIITPRPDWYWYWNSIPGQGGGSVPKPTTTVPTPTQVGPIPAQEWANGIVLGLEKMSNNIVLNVQQFANKLMGAQQPVPRPVRRESSCVCACAHCACACACVSCACACAGGGAR